MSSSSEGMRPRRSSIDLGELEGRMPDASFDILRGELELGTSADVSFVSFGTGEQPPIAREEENVLVTTSPTRSVLFVALDSMAERSVGIHPRKRI